MTDINDNLIQLAETKANIKKAIANKGINITSKTPFSDYPSKIGEIYDRSLSTFAPVTLYGTELINPLEGDWTITG